jgi:hypothetical protein
MKHILFNIASRSRPKKFNDLVRSIHELCTQPFTILAKLDEDDPSLSEYNLKGVTPAIGTSTSKIDAINRDIPKSGWDILVDVSDDFVFVRQGFDDIIRLHCGWDDVVNFPEPFAKGRIVIMAVMGNKYYNRFGYIFNPVYMSLFCDDELTEVSKLTGAYKFVQEDIFYHAHPSAGYGKPDRQTVFTESFWNTDKKTFEKRKSENFGL